MELITQAQTDQLLANGRAQCAAIDQNAGALDIEPVVKLFTPDAGCTWLLTELDSDGLLFGLCDLGLGCPELGYAPAATSNSSTRVRVKIPHLAAAGRGMITRSDASWQDAQRIL